MHGLRHRPRVHQGAGSGREGVGAYVEELRADGEEDLAGEREDVGRGAALGAARVSGRPNDLDHEDGAADRGDRVRCLDLDLIARLHPILGDSDGDLPGVEIDGRAAGNLGDGQRRALTDGDDGPATQEQTREGAVAGDDAVVQQDIVLELEGYRLRLGRAGSGDVALEIGDDAGFRCLTECERGPDRGEQRHCENVSIDTSHAAAPLSVGRPGIPGVGMHRIRPMAELLPLDKGLSSAYQISDFLNEWIVIRPPLGGLPGMLTVA